VTKAKKDCKKTYMALIDFQEATVYSSTRSPYGRRVRLAFIENNVPYMEEMRDVWKFDADYAEINPVHRVPTVVLYSGQVLVESSLILDLFYRTPSRTLRYLAPEETMTGYYWSGLFLGIMDKTIEYFLETLRAEGSRDPEIMADLPQVVVRVLSRFEAEIGRRNTLFADRLTQADLDIGSALGYLEFRLGAKVLKDHPNTERYFRGLESRPSFQGTKPS
jgi:glutathione S-transferase